MDRPSLGPDGRVGKKEKFELEGLAHSVSGAAFCPGKFELDSQVLPQILLFYFFPFREVLSSFKYR